MRGCPFVADQMGVELGKVLAKNILAQLDKPEDVTGHDSSVSRSLASSNTLFLFATWIDYWPDPLLPKIQEGINPLQIQPSIDSEY